MRVAPEARSGRKPDAEPAVTMTTGMDGSWCTVWPLGSGRPCPCGTRGRPVAQPRPARECRGSPGSRGARQRCDCRAASRSRDSRCSWPSRCHGADGMMHTGSGLRHVRELPRPCPHGSWHTAPRSTSAGALRGRSGKCASTRRRPQPCRRDTERRGAWISARAPCDTRCTAGGRSSPRLRPPRQDGMTSRAPPAWPQSEARDSDHTAGAAPRSGARRCGSSCRRAWRRRASHGQRGTAGSRPGAGSTPRDRGSRGRFRLRLPRRRAAGGRSRSAGAWRWGLPTPRSPARSDTGRSATRLRPPHACRGTPRTPSGVPRGLRRSAPARRHGSCRTPRRSACRHAVRGTSGSSGARCRSSACGKRRRRPPSALGGGARGSPGSRRGRWRVGPQASAPGPGDSPSRARPRCGSDAACGT
jgi:hypothetical protein